MLASSNWRSHRRFVPESDALLVLDGADDVETGFQQAMAIQFTVFLAWSYD